MMTDTQSLDALRQTWRKDFPILNREVHGKPLAYLDNAATTQKPLAVIEAIDHYYRHLNSNVHRGVHQLSQEATDAYEAGRQKIASLLHAENNEIIFTRGTTESINLVAASYGRANVGAGDEILISHMEHHSNLVPWQMLCEEKGAVLKVIPINDKGELDMEAFSKMLSKKVKLVGLVHISNSLGTINPVEQVIEQAHEHGIPVLLDGAQALPHEHVDVKALDCDFYAFSAHKMYGPTGMGGLYGKKELLDSMPPYQGGGDMILNVSFDGTTYNEVPHKFEAGTPNIAGAIGMGAAAKYIQSIGYENIQASEADLLAYGTDKLQAIDGLTLIGTADHKTSVLSFVLDDIHPHDIGTILDSEGIAIRTGHHCTQPVMDRFGVPATSRASLAFYNTHEEIDRLADAVIKVKEMFA
jgi:cysteine desulfurase/selenocysteine lyase